MAEKNKIARAFFLGFTGGVLFLFSVFLIFQNDFQKEKPPESDPGENFSLPPWVSAVTKISASDEANDFHTHTDDLTENFAFDGNAITLPTGTPASDSEPRRIEFADGDLYERYGGGRDDHPSNTPNSNDRRLQIDARVPVEISSKLKIYGVSTMTLGETESTTISDYTRNYGIGGGIGFSYEISPYAELDFDYRRTHPIESQNDNPATESAGISVRLKF